MKKITILSATLLLLAPIPVACQHHTMPEATEAAKAVYEQYADREGLTVALVGDYHTDRGTYTAVMMQADDDSTWHQLLGDFGFDYLPETVSAKLDSLPFAPVKVTSLSKGISTVVATDSLDNALVGLPEDIKKIVLDAIGDAKHSGSMTITRTETYRNDTLVSAQADTTHTIDTAHVRRMVGEGSLMHTANSNGDHGYIDYCDHSTRTLWLFFFRTAQEMEDILKQVVDTQLPPQE